VSVLFTATLLITLLSAVIGIHSVLFFIPDLAFKAVNFCIAIFDYKFFIISGITFGAIMIFYYLALLVASGFFNLKRMTKIAFSFVLIGIFAFGTLFYNLSLNNNFYLIVSGSESLCFSIIDTPESNVMIISDVKGFYSRGRLKRIANYNQVKKIDNLIFTNGYTVDTVALVTELRSVFELENVYYYGEKNQKFEKVFSLAFKNYSVKNYVDKEDFCVSENLRFSAKLDGRVINVHKNQTIISIFSPLGEQVSSLDSLDKNYKYAVFLENGERMDLFVKPRKAIFYREQAYGQNAETMGNLTILI
jgi:hypothetical protein